MREDALTTTHLICHRSGQIGTTLSITIRRCNCLLAEFIEGIRTNQRLYESLSKKSFRDGNTPMQYTAIFAGVNLDNFQMTNSDMFHIAAQEIKCEYSLEPPY